MGSQAASDTAEGRKEAAAKGTGILGTPSWRSTITEHTSSSVPPEVAYSRYFSLMPSGFRFLSTRSQVQGPQICGITQFAGNSALARGNLPLFIFLFFVLLESTWLMNDISPAAVFCCRIAFFFPVESVQKHGLDLCQNVACLFSRHGSFRKGTS